ncbi:MAG: hypothetical protein IJW29_06045 [Clostridia bacterium]|nr:hypothetical protein [Clostridia bacterium]
MKKLLALLLAACACFSVCTVLTACDNRGEHTHAFSKKWSSNNSYHWHECEDESCDEIVDKAEHTFKMHESVSDVLVCTVCGKLENPTPGLLWYKVTEAEWRAALSESAFTVNGYLNVTVKYTDAASESICYIANGVHKEGDSVSENFTFEEFCRRDCGTAFEMIDLYASFQYNAETGSYVLYDAAVDDEKIELAFKNKKLVSCTVTIGVGTEDEESWTHTYYNVGTTVIP